MIELEVLEGETRGRVHRIEESVITIGRHESNLVVLPDYHISGEHAQIFWEDNQYIFRDLRSTSGSVLARRGHGIPLDGSERWEIPLKVGDQLRLGSPYSPVVLLVRAIDSVEAEMPATTTLMAARTLEEIDTLRSQASTDRELAAIMYRLVQTIGRGGLELQTVLDSVCEAVFELLERASNVSLYLRDPISLRFKMVFARSREGAVDTSGGSRSLVEMVLKRKAAVLVADAPGEMAQSASIVAASIRSIMAVPMWNGNQIIGVLQCDNRTQRGLFQEKDLEYLTLLSYQSVLAIENARMYRMLEEKKERVQSENNYYRQRASVRCFSDIVGNSAAMRRIFEQLEKVIDTRVAISIHGETGTGKELIASAIHYQSRRREKMFVAQNCAALPETLLESELFGHVKGAFTGADRDKKGLFEIADGGTLFLDEIADMPLSLQVKLLRVLQEGEIRPLGSTQVKYVDVRIISASHKNLEEEVAAGRFREDLFYRLHVFPIHLPPLRERREDIPLLVEHFVQKYASGMQKRVTVDPQTLKEMQEVPWKGNVRELENEVQRLVILADDGGVIRPSDLRPQLRQETSLIAEKALLVEGTLKEMMEEVERQILVRVLEECDQNKTRAAARLGITREGLHKKLAKYGL